MNDAGECACSPICRMAGAILDSPKFLRCSRDTFSFRRCCGMEEAGRRLRSFWLMHVTFTCLDYWKRIPNQETQLSRPRPFTYGGRPSFSCVVSFFTRNGNGDGLESS